MGRLHEQIRAAILREHFLVSLHADERCEERGVSPWQLAAGIEQSKLVREVPMSQPNPTVLVEQLLADGSVATCVWSWLPQRGCALLVTVYFKE